MRTPLRASAASARDALRLAVAEATILGTADHAAVDAAVRLVKASADSRHFASLVNAVARKAIATPLDLDPATSLPEWLRSHLCTDWGAETGALLKAMTSDAPLDLTPRDPAEGAAWAQRLGATVLPNGSIRLYDAGQITALPGFEAGAWWVQDAAASLPARLLRATPGETIVDMCAAPGGKTLQLAAQGAAVTAVDISPDRLARVAENLERTGLSATLVVADATAWAPSGLVDAVLLDAPCSATGTLRRHPDLPHLRRVSDLEALNALQDRLVEAAWAMLKPGGRLVYATCSLLKSEGETRIAAFLQRIPDAGVDAIGPDEASDARFVTREGFLRTLPHAWDGGLDGFFAARLIKHR